MLLNMLIAVHVLLGVTTLGTGITACIRIASGDPFSAWAARFLQFSLAAAAAGILLSIFHPDPVRWVAVLAVYVSCVAVWAWRRRSRLARATEPFVVSTMAVLCLDSLIMVAHLLRIAAPGGSHARPTPIEILVDAVLILFFVVLSGLSLRSVHHNIKLRFVP